MLLGTEGPVMTLNDEDFSFLSLSTYIPPRNINTYTYYTHMRPMHIVLFVVS